MTKEPTTPNIFHYATSELSQDAVIAYILAWADPKLRDAHSKLNKLGKELLDALLSQAVAAYDKTISIPEITKLRVGTQDNRIDVYVVINESIFLIIEDKTYTKEHSDQIARYKKVAESIENKDKTSFEHILAVYVKTGNESKNSRPKKADGSCYGCFYRNDFLGILGKNPCTGNNIIEEFRSHLQEWEEDTQSFKTTLFAEWTWRAHEGYYLALEKGLGGDFGSDWSYVSNPAGGALVFWWWPNEGYKPENSKCEFYLQIDQHKGLFIRVSERKDDDGKPIKVGVDFLWEVLEKAQKHAKNIDEGMQVEKPSRYRSGWTASAAQIYFGKEKDEQGRPSYIATKIATKQDRMIDLAATIERLKKATKLVGCLYGKD